MSSPWVIRLLVLVIAVVGCRVAFHSAELAYPIAAIAGLVAIQVKYGELYRGRSEGR